MRGLNAPPRRKVAPLFFTDSATVHSCASLSTEQGPAMTWKNPSPMVLPATATCVSRGWKRRFAFL